MKSFMFIDQLICVVAQSVVRHLTLVLEVPGSIPASDEGNFGGTWLRMTGALIVYIMYM